MVIIFGIISGATGYFIFRFFPDFSIHWVLGGFTFLFWCSLFVYFLPNNYPLGQKKDILLRSGYLSVIFLIFYIPCYFLGFSIFFKIGW